MKEIPRIRQASPVINGVLKIVWNDDYEAVVDLRPVIASGKIFAFLNDSQQFDQVGIGEFGSSIFWHDAEDRIVDIGTLSLRERAEAQADIVRLAI